MKKKVILIIILAVAVILAAVGFMLYSNVTFDDTPGWKERNGKDICYIKEDGSKAVGYQMIADRPYYFEQNGKPAEKGWIKDDKETFYSRGNGRLETGWQYLDGKVWYFFTAEDGEDKKPGMLAKNWTTSGGIPISKEGYVDGDRGLALAYGIDVLNRYGWNLKAAYEYSSSLRFEKGSDEHYGMTIHGCALHGFKNGSGNCLAWSGTFCVMARLLGYDCRQIWGTLQWKGVVPHAWTEIWEEDGIHVYDPRKHEGEDLAGFDVRYGDEGTYKYDEEHKQYLEW